MKKSFYLLLMSAAVLLLFAAGCAKDIPVEQVSVEPQEVTLALGESVVLSVTVLPEDADYELAFSSNNEEVATVSAEGEVEAGLLIGGHVFRDLCRKVGRFHHGVFQAVKEGVALNVFEVVGILSLCLYAQSQLHAERRGGVGGSVEVEGVLFPAVVFGNGRSIDVLDGEGILRNASDGVVDPDVSAAVSVYGLAVVKRHIGRFDPDGDLSRRTRRQSDGGGGVARRRTQLVGTVVVEHQNVRSVLLVLRFLRREGSAGVQLFGCGLEFSHSLLVFKGLHGAAVECGLQFYAVKAYLSGKFYIGGLVVARIHVPNLHSSRFAHGI